MKDRAEQNAESGKGDNTAPFYIKVTYVCTYRLCLYIYICTYLLCIFPEDIIYTCSTYRILLICVHLINVSVKHNEIETKIKLLQINEALLR